MKRELPTGTAMRSSASDVVQAGVAPADSERTRGVLSRFRESPFVSHALVRLSRSPLARRVAHGAFWTLAGTVLSRVLALGTSVATARLLGKEGFGELGVLNSTIGMVQAFAGFGIALTATKYVSALRAEDPGRTARILGLSEVVAASTGAIACALLWVFSAQLATGALGHPRLAPLIRIAAPGLMLSTLVGAQAGVLAGFEAFRSLARVNWWSGLLSVPVAIAGVYYWGIAGAVWATVISAAVQWVLSAAAVRAEKRRCGLPSSITGWRFEYRVLLSFSLPALLSGIMVGPVNWIAIAMTTKQPGGLLEIATFSAANQWFTAVTLIPSVLGITVLPVLSERFGQGDRKAVAKVLRGVVGISSIVTIPVVLAGLVASPAIMALYGAGYREAWTTFGVVLVTAGLVTVSFPLGQVLAASESLWIGFIFNGAWAAVFLALTHVLVVREGLGALGLASARLVAYGAHTAWTLWYVGRQLRTTAPSAMST